MKVLECSVLIQSTGKAYIKWYNHIHILFSMHADFRNLDLYVFFTSGDLLDAPEWDSRFEADGDKGQHDVGHFRMALELAKYVVEA